MSNLARIAFQLFKVQAAITVSVGAVFFAISGKQAALSALTGGVIGISATGLFSFKILRGGMQWSAQRFLQKFVSAEIQKLALIVILVLIALRWFAILALPMSLTLVAVLLANWILLLFKP